MNNTKTTKRALLSSVMAMLICVAMLIGTTFAWFTDSASTAVNKIQAGTLEVGLEMKNAEGNWVDAEGKTLGWVAKDGRAQDQILWEPGCTYELPELRIVNKGNLALKYKMIVSGIVGDAKLLDVITFTYGTGIDINAEVSLAPNAKTEDIVIKGKMAETAGNEYQGLSIDGIGITVVATQDTVEYDSNNNIYDTDATYLNTDAQGNNYFISNANELVYFAKTVNVDGETYAGKTVKLTADIDLAGKKWIPVGNSGSISGYPSNKTFKGTFDGNGMTITGLKVNVNGEFAAAGLFGAANRATIKNVVLDGADIRSTHYAGAILGYDTDTTVVSGCTVKNSTITSAAENSTGSWDNGDKVGGIVGYMNVADVSNCSVSNTSIQGYRDIGGIVGYIGGGTVSDCGIDGVTIYVDNSHNYKNYTTLSEHDANDYVGDSSGAISGCSGTATITKLVTVSNATELRELAADSTVTNASITLPKTTAEAPLTTNISVPGGKNLTINGATSNPADTVINGQIATIASNEGTLVIRNCTINVDDNIVDSTGISQTGSSAIAIWGDQKVICENVVFNMSKANSTAITSWWDTGVGTNIIARNCTFNCNGQRPIRATCNVTVENCTFNDPYRYAVQLTSKSNTAVGIEKAVINFNNNTINNGASGKAFVYGVQLEGEDYGCQNLIINGSGNTINAGEWDTGNESTMYYCECGLVQHNTITWNTEVVPVHKDL